MNAPSQPHRIDGVVVIDETPLLGLDELCRACGMTPQDMSAWVEEGIVEAEGRNPAEWRFGGVALRRARAAARLSSELQLDLEALALVLDLLERIEHLKAQLRHAGDA